MKQLKIKTIKYYLIIISIFLGAFPLINIHGLESKTIKVGYYNEKDYHSIDANNNHYGYDYEYLKEIAKYTNWNYEFIEGTWQECITRLESGQIDLLGGVERTDERLTTMTFAKMPSIYATNCLLIEKDSDKYAFEDFKAFNGMKVGVLKGSTLVNGLKKYCNENNFVIDLAQYNNEKELKQALKKHEVDSIYLTNVRNLADYKIIAHLDFVNFYYALSNQRSDLKEDLDNAQKQISIKDHYFERSLFEEFFSSPTQIAFTKEEQDFIKKNNQVDVILLTNYPIICDYDKTKKEYNGIVVDALEQISKKTGLEFNYIKVPDDEVWQYMKSNPNTIIAPTLFNNLVTFDENIKILDTLVTGRMVTVSKVDKTINLSKDFTLALPKGMLGAKEKLEKEYPEITIKYCDFYDDAIKMVNDDIADLCLVNEIMGAYTLQSPYYQDLKLTNTENFSEDITFSLSNKSNPLLISILNKSIISFNERDIRQLVIDNTVNHPYQLDFNEWVYDNALTICLSLLVVVSVIFALFYRIKVRKKEAMEMQKIQIIEERHKADLEYQAKMVRRARYDSLTNLYSKDYFIEKTNELLKNNPNKVYTLIRINVENFKLINKVYGQEIGDVVLLKIAEKMRNTINQSGVYGRIYADHFAICYPLTPLEIKQLTALKANYIEIDGQYIRVQVNMGIYINQAHLLDACQLLDYALMAMQNQDASSSKHISFFKESYLATLIKNQEITNEMDSALESGQFHVYLQPQFEIFSNKLVGAEALVRWMHPQKGIISPNQFIPVFENNRFIYKLDNYVFECVCKQLASWQRMGKIIPISVNLSRINLLNPDLLLMIEQNLLKYQIPVEYIHLEITESIYAEDQQELIGIVKQLQERGFVIEMDDFGSGYSSLNMLKDVPVDILKMDIEFFSGETHMERGANIIEAIVNLAHSLDILVIVEGVETIREINFLKSINCHFAQGYFFGKAMSASDFTVVLQENVIAPKTIELVHNNRYENLYWKIEKLNNLMLSEQAILLDYDPNDDYVVFSHIGKDGEIHERGISDYGLNMLKNETIHPNYRLYLKDILLGKKKQKEEVDYLADYLKIGRFEQYHATVYCHFRDNKLNRVIGIIKKCND